MLAIVRRIAIAGLAGLIVGPVVGGLGARLFMRIAGALAPAAAQGATTEAGFTIGEVTFRESLGLVLFAGIPAGIFGATLAVIAGPWLVWAGRWRGLALGVLLFAIGSAVSDVMNRDNIDFLLIGHEVVVIGMILLLFLAFGVAMDAVMRRLDRRLPAAAEASIGWRVTWGAITAIGALLGGLTVSLSSFTSSFCSCDPPILAASSVVVMAVATAASWVLEVRGSAPEDHALVRAIGYAGLAGAVGFGLARAVSDASDIIG